MMYSYIAGVAVSMKVMFLVQLLAVLEAPIMLTLVSMLHINKLTNWNAYKYFQKMGFFVFAGHFLFCSCVLHSMALLLNRMFSGKLTLLIMLFVVGGTMAMALIFSLGKKICPRLMRLWDGTL